MKIEDIVAPEMRDYAQAELTNKANEQFGLVYVVDIITKHGIRVPLEVSTRVVVRQGKPIQIEGHAQPEIRFRELSETTAPLVDKDFSASLH